MTFPQHRFSHVCVSQALFKHVDTPSRWERASSLSLPTGFFRVDPGVAFSTLNSADLRSSIILRLPFKELAHVKEKRETILKLLNAVKTCVSRGAWTEQPCSRGEVCLMR